MAFGVATPKHSAWRGEGPAPYAHLLRLAFERLELRLGRREQTCPELNLITSGVLREDVLFYPFF
jgi:hypothetical protein